MSSFNIEAIALECVDEGANEAESLAEVFSHGAKEIEANGETDDPAGVSGPIRLLLDRDVVVARLQKASELMQRALDHEDDEDATREALSELFWKYVDPPGGSSSKPGLGAALRKGSTFSVGPTGLTVGSGTGTKDLKSGMSDGPMTQGPTHSSSRARRRTAVPSGARLALAIIAFMRTTAPTQTIAPRMWKNISHSWNSMIPLPTCRH